MSVSIIVQRFRECKLLLNETDWITVGSNNNSNSCGLLVYISFASTTTTSHVEQSAQTVLNLPVLTTGLWGDGESSTSSVLSLAAQVDPTTTSSCSLVIVPQANLVSKVKQMGKSIQYHGQIDKKRGEEMYHYFCDVIRGKLLEEQCRVRAEDLPEWYTKRQSHLEKLNNNKQPSPSILPNQLFYDESKYSAYDENGIPTKDVEGNDLTKSAMKKLNKLHQAHCKRHTKWKEHDTDATTEELAVVGGRASSIGDDPPEVHWEDSLDPSFCQVVVGSFGRRQGLEFSSDMGPFVHLFQV
jgi:hypothetical protein